MSNLERKVQYLEVAEQLSGWIREKKLKPGSLIISLRKISEIYGVSHTTATNAVKHLVAEGVLYREHGSGTYVKNNGTELNIGCIISSPVHAERDAALIIRRELHECSAKAIDYLASNGCRVRHIPCLVVYDNKELSEYINNLDGLLISGIDVVLQRCIHLQDLNIPVVFFHHEFEFNYPFSQVLPDHYVAMRQIFKKLRPEEYEKIIIVYYNHLNNITRRDAFAACAAEAGFKKEQIELCEVAGEAYQHGMKISEIPGRKFICTCTALLTTSIYDALLSKGQKTGRDFELVEYDNFEELINPDSPPHFTAIDYAREMAAQLAAELLIKEIREKKEYKQIIKVPTRLVIRETTKKNE